MDLEIENRLINRYKIVEIVTYDERECYSYLKKLRSGKVRHKLSGSRCYGDKYNSDREFEQHYPMYDAHIDGDIKGYSITELPKVRVFIEGLYYYTVHFNTIEEANTAARRMLLGGDAVFETVFGMEIEVNGDVIILPIEKHSELI